MKRGYTLFWLIPFVLVVSLYPILMKSVIARETVFIMLMYVTLAVSLNIIMGYTGYVSFGHIVFYGIGGYTSFYLMYRFGVHLIPAMLAGGIVSALIALAIGEAVLRLRGAIFAIATIGVNEAIKSLVTNLSFLGGATGLFFNFRIYRTYGGAAKAIWFAYYVMVVVTLVTIIVAYLIKTSKFGLGLFSIREDEDAAYVLGVNTKRFKSLAYAYSAFFPGLVGAIFFFKSGNIEPEDAFHLVKSIEMIFMVMLGGYGTVSGPVLGALIYERLKGMLLVNPLFKNLHMAIAGVILLVIVLFAPGGLVGYLRDKFKKLRGVLE
ncbi:branched-chain amino acid transport system permease [Thermosulfidibacter takaii ABI70S6]|uniref:Branched-chain amino acid transport system permease n=1 Tax=Thermosulfidibacter takaii (strain DSM 17441 / JCM 13301 / NBRC 103674 / ABI70S6) TaxID=1298851 RepID=A0A0S3QVT5_THET7|nr:branched-chain amino acid ABC transporter permease [Thermosulfidibacter takaii]BAT72437.1 branched-chain amino acid transport system permease [Thermosulfidibacter takaii ABI70S6]